MVEQVQNRSDHHESSGEHVELRLIAEHEQSDRDRPYELGVLHGRDTGGRRSTQRLQQQELRSNHHEA